MNRRKLLAVLGSSLVGTVGCLSSDGSGDGDPATDSPQSNTTTTPSPTETNSADIDVSFGPVQPTVVELLSDRLHVASMDSRFLYTTIEASRSASPAHEDFRLQSDDAEYEPAPSRVLYRMRTHQRYSESSRKGWILFRLPETGDYDDLRLTWRDRDWQVPDSIQRRLETKPARFDVSASFPGTVQPEEEPTIPISVTNKSNRSGRFVAGLTRSGPSVASRPVALITEPVEAGKSIDTTVLDDKKIGTVSSEDRGDGNPDMSYNLDWETGSVDGSVRIGN